MRIDASVRRGAAIRASVREHPGVGQVLLLELFQVAIEVDEDHPRSEPVRHDAAAAAPRDDVRRAPESIHHLAAGRVVEHGETGQMFVTPRHKETEDYIEGRYG